MGYCEISDVEQLSTGRKSFAADTKPTASQVVDYIEQTAGILDGILRGRQYQLPVPTTATSALKVLESFNAYGAACMVEQSAPVQRPTDRGRSDAGVCAMWKSAQAMLKSGDLELELEVNVSTGSPRGGPVASPFFSRDMQL